MPSSLVLMNRFPNWSVILGFITDLSIVFDGPSRYFTYSLLRMITLPSWLQLRFGCEQTLWDNSLWYRCHLPRYRIRTKCINFSLTIQRPWSIEKEIQPTLLTTYEYIHSPVFIRSPAFASAKSWKIVRSSTKIAPSSKTLSPRSLAAPALLFAFERISFNSSRAVLRWNLNLGLCLN